MFGNAATVIKRENDRDQSALLLRDVTLSKPGLYEVLATDGVNTREVTWTVYETKCFGWPIKHPSPINSSQ